MSVSLLTSDWATYGSGPWWVENNVWGNGSLINGVDYTQSITINNSTFPNGTLLSWSWPSTPGPSGVYAFPEIIYGSTPYVTNSAVPSTQVANFANLSTSYSITLSGNTNNYDTIFDLWLTSKPNGGPSTIQYEIIINAHMDWAPSYAPAFTINDSTLHNANVYLFTGSWTRIDVMPQSDILSGTINISDIIKNLIWDGVITGQEYLSGAEFGAEPATGSGSLLVNNLSYQWSGTPTIEGTAGNDTFNIASPGGNHVEGNGGIDTVVYSGLYSQFQIKSSGSELLVMENNNISTLDLLDGVTYIKFSDGTYDAATSIFTPTNSNIITYSASNTNLTVTDSNDTVIVSGSNDAVNLTGGSDVVQLSGNNDSLTIAGSGNSISVTGSNDSVVLSTGADTVTFSGSGTVNATIGSGATLNLIDSLTGSGSDTLALTGNSGTANLTHLAHFSGFSGVSLSGSSDTLTLTNDNLTVTRLSGSGDTISLGTGIDTVAYTSVNQSTHSSQDTIIGFNTSQDMIDFSAISGLNSNTQPITINFLTSTPKDIAGHTIDVVTSGGNMVVYANATGLQ